MLHRWFLPCHAPELCLEACPFSKLQQQPATRQSPAPLVVMSLAGSAGICSTWMRLPPALHKHGPLFCQRPESHLIVPAQQLSLMALKQRCYHDNMQQISDDWRRHDMTADHCCTAWHDSIANLKHMLTYHKTYSLPL